MPPTRKKRVVIRKTFGFTFYTEVGIDSRVYKRTILRKIYTSIMKVTIYFI